MSLKVENGLALSRVDNIVCDNQNIIWIKSSRGLQFWDGQHIHTFRDSLLDIGSEFQLYPHSEKGIIVSIPGLARQIIFDGLRQATIYKAIDLQNDFIPIPLPSATSNYLLIHPDTISYNKEGLQVSEFIEKRKVVSKSNILQYHIEGINYLVDFQTHNCIQINSGVVQKLDSLFINPIRNSLIIEQDEIIFSAKTGITVVNNTTESIYPYPNNLKASYYSSILKIAPNKLLVGIDNVLCEFDLTHNKWTSVYKNIDQNDLLQTGYFDKLILDKFNNIWAITVNEGLLKIYNNDSFKYFGTNDKKLNFVKNIVADEKNNRIIVAALNGGIMIYDTLGNQTYHLNSKNTHGLVNSVTGIYKVYTDQYIFNNHLDSLIYSLSFDKSKTKINSIAKKQETYLYYQDAISLNENTSLLLFNTLYQLQHSPFRLSPLFQHIATKPCMVKDGDIIWIGCNDGLLKYKVGSGADYQVFNLPGEGYVRSISNWKNNELALGTDRGLSIFNKRNSELIHIDEGCIYCLLSDDEDNIWAGTGAGITRYDPFFNKTHYSRSDGLQNNEFNTNACVKSASGKMYFGGLNGITSFDPKSVATKEHSANLYIKDLTAGNTNLIKNAQLENLQHLNLPHNENNLSVSIGAIGKFESDDYNYQYFVEGISSNWIDAKHQTKYNFNLSPGHYKFYFLASNTFNPKADLKKPVLITISNPWWRQWWFYLLVALTIIGIIAYIIKAKERQKYLKKKFEWDLAYQRQEDRMKMSKELHDNIGSRLTFLVSSIENIKKAFHSDAPQALTKIDHLTDFGKDTIEDLRSMMWVLNQQSITIQDLQLKVLDYLNIAKNTYRKIDFQYEGPSNGLEQKLDSKLSQNIFRVIQEGIHNSIKHANPSVITIAISNENHKINVSIEDNGNGFDQENINPGNGLHNMKSRLSEHGGEIEITSHPNEGTVLQFEVETI